jgi:3D (Asp-Asp-Asp) domain-containing protein
VEKRSRWPSAGLVVGAVVVVYVVVVSAMLIHSDGIAEGACAATCINTSDGRGVSRWEGSLLDRRCSCDVPPSVDPEPEASPEVFVATVTAYSPYCKGCSGKTRSGEWARPGTDTIAADLRSWPLGSCVDLLLPDRGWVVHRVNDTGGAFDQRDRFDLLVRTQAAARKWGRKRIAARAATCPT